MPSMQADVHGGTNASAAGKVPIPRLPQDEPNSTADGRKKRMSRTGKACTLCRKRKVKCSGETPRCDNCRAGDHDCIYDLARKDRLMTATSQNHELVTLLKDLSLRVDHVDRQRIKDTLAAVDDQPTAAVSVKSLGKRRATDEESDAPGETRSPASIGSNEDLDLVDEDYLRSRESRETGYLGVNSEVRWLKSVQREMALGDSEPQGLPYGPPGHDPQAQALRADAYQERKKAGRRSHFRPLNETTFYLDTDSLDLHILVDSHQLPPVEIAEQLLACFMNTVHKSFPILPKSFDKQFEKYFHVSQQGARLQVPDKWLAILNLVFAIGSRFSHLVKAEWRGDEREHLVYMTRAIRLLGQDTNNMFLSAPDLGVIQATGLLSFYYLAIGHVSRAWVMIGVAIRLGLALGLHLRNADDSMSLDKKETMVRTWWSLHSVECLLSAITGRPCVLPLEDCSVDLPNAHEQSRTSLSGDSSSRSKSIRTNHHRAPGETGSSATHSDPERSMHQSGSYLDAYLSIGLITQKAIASLYSPRTATQTWDNIQSAITERTTELQKWKRGALPEEDGVLYNPFPAPDGLRELTLLRFSYYSLKILVTRPCLCRMERRIRGQTSGSADFNQKVAEACVKAAQDMVSMLPEQPNPQDLYETGPWWSIVHHLMQAMTVLLLELSYQGTHTHAGRSNIPGYIKKLVRWFRALRATDAVAGRAYDVVVGILEDSNPIFQTIATQILAEDEERGSEYGHSSFPPDLSQAFPSHASETDVGPSGSNAGYDPGFNHARLHSYPAIADPRIFTDLGHMQAQQQPVQQQAPQDDFFSFTTWVPNPSAYSNPFSTSFDQPALLGMPDLWSIVESSTGGSQLPMSAPAQQHYQDEYKSYDAQHQGQ